ncbi:hypothetical protein BDQ17DRAFT_1414617 [Cyathus striatus]|nr:hypothetical protein BDQ17DRAFT_1414617 [Cyathus striatus]
MNSIAHRSGIYYGDVASLLFLTVTGRWSSDRCFGVVILQCWSYYTGSFKDRIGLRLFVASILIMSAISACINTVIIHDNMLVENANKLFVRRPESMLIATISISGVLFFLVHGFFASRLFLLTKKRFVPIVIVRLRLIIIALNEHLHNNMQVTLSIIMLGLSACTNTVLGEIYSCLCLTDLDTSLTSDTSLSEQYFQKKKLPITLFHGFAAVADIIVSISFSYTLMVPVAYGPGPVVYYYNSDYDCFAGARGFGG